jgi:hypothetical protein
MTRRSSSMWEAHALRAVRVASPTPSGAFRSSPPGLPPPRQCVVMAGLVWNAPLSCAWAGRVFVSNREARDHGLRSVGLPSRLAAFESAPAPAGGKPRRGGPGSWWRKGRRGEGAASSGGPPPPAAALARLLDGKFTDAVALRNTERGRRGLAAPVATFLLPPLRTEGFLGPRMRLSLPSFRWGPRFRGASRVGQRAEPASPQPSPTLLAPRPRTLPLPCPSTPP